MAELSEYLWMVVVGIIAGFVMSFGIGANDVANAFASSVAAKSLSLGQAVIVASIFEFCGAVFLGQSVSSTIRGKIIDSEYYEDQPEVFMFGMLCALCIASVWLLVATAFELPVSTTHTIVAGILGFSLAAEGFKSIEWDVAVKIFVSWFISPTFTGVISFAFFFGIKKLVLEAEETFKRALRVFPLVIFAGISVNLAFILIKSEKKIKEKNDIENYGKVVVLPVAVGTAALCAISFWLVIGPRLEARVIREQQEHEEAMQAGEQESDEGKVNLVENPEAEPEPTVTHNGSDSDTREAKDVNEEVVLHNTEKDSVLKDPFSGNRSEQTKSLHQACVDFADKDETIPEKAPSSEDENILKDPIAGSRQVKTSSLHAAWGKFADNTFRQDIEGTSFHESKRAKEIWENSTATDPSTERLFSYLQVFTACLTSFAHGSNDVANAIAAVSAVLDVYEHGEIQPKAEVEKWLLAMGGAGICLGFTLYGYKIIKAVGFKLTCMTPSRGFCIQLATALAVSLASFMQIPVSSTQCLVGATVGAGVAAGGIQQVQWMYLFRVTTGWVVTFFVTCITAAGFFAFCAYSPSLVDR